MDIRIAAQETRKCLPKCKDGRHVRILGGDATSIEHIAAMLTSIETGVVSEAQAQQWLGWAQAIICSRGGATLDELRQINTKASA